jgi:pilus assembly protein CpaE
MTNHPTLLAVCANPELKTMLERVAGAKGLKVGKINQYLNSRSRVNLSQLPEDAPCIAFIDFTINEEQGIKTAEVLSASVAPRVWPVAVSNNSDSDAVLRAMRAGCSEFLYWPSGDLQVGAALNNVLSRVASLEGETSGSGMVVVFIGVRGGTGTTTLAVHTALELAALPEKRVMIVDLYRHLGNVALYLNQHNPGYSFSRILDDVHRLDGALLQTMVSRHSTGLSVLCSPDECGKMFDSQNQKISRQDPSSTGAIDQVLGLFRAENDITIFDADMRLPETLAVARHADHVFIVASLDIVSIRNVGRYMDLLGRDPARQMLIITHAGQSVLTPETLGDAAGIPIISTMHDISHSITEHLDAGIQIPHSVREFYDNLKPVLAQIDDNPAQPVGKKAFFSFRSKR